MKALIRFAKENEKLFWKKCFHLTLKENNVCTKRVEKVEAQCRAGREISLGDRLLNK